MAAAVNALTEAGEGFTVGASCGAVLLPHEATDPDYALQLADKRMYANKRGRTSGARKQTQDVLMRIIQARQPRLAEHSSDVGELALLVARRLRMSAEQPTRSCAPRSCTTSARSASRTRSWRSRPRWTSTNGTSSASTPCWESAS